MEELSLHIEYLLLRHDCVIVPGLGAFIVRREGARIDHAAGVILPPTREVAFNREVQTDDGLLAHSVARRASLPFEEGRELMQREVSEIKEHLLTEGEVTIGHVGTLTVGEEGTMQFFPYRRNGGEGVCTGFVNVSMRHSRHIEAYNEPQAENESIISEPALGQAATDMSSASFDNVKDTYPAEDREACDIAEKERNHSNGRSPYYHIRIRKTYAHIAASMILVVMLGLSFLLPSSSRNDATKALASVVPVEAIGRTVSPEQEGNQGERTEEREERGEREESEKKIEKEVGASTEEASVSQKSITYVDHKNGDEETLLPYYLIVATFRTQAEANRYVEDSPSSSKLFCIGGNKLFRVAISGSDDKEVLQAMLNDKEFKSKYPGAWVWKSRKN